MELPHLLLAVGHAARPLGRASDIETVRGDLVNRMAFDAIAPVGGAAVAWRSPKVHMLEGRDDLAVLWDFRVHPDYRRKGIGTALFRRAAQWARSKGCKQLKIETQNVNVPACRFYAAQRCHLGRIDRYGYAEPDIAHETMLIWYLDL